MNVGETNKCNLREAETLAEVVKYLIVCMIKVFPDTEKFEMLCVHFVKEINYVVRYRSETHFKHNILSLRSLTSFQSDKNYRTGVN